MKIYVRLLDEGTEVLRPTFGKPIGNDTFELLPTSDYDPRDEKWEFAPGSIVKCVTRKSGGKNIAVAEGLYTAKPKT